MTTADVAELIRAHSRPLAPIPTHVKPRCERLSGIRAVLFDVYGTLLISASGDIGSNPDETRLAAAETLRNSLGSDHSDSAETILSRFDETILRHHSDARQQGISHPEVDILRVWAETLGDLVDLSEVQRWALEFELRTNPVWPMPGTSDVFANLQSSLLLVGLVSNAQFYTIELFSPLVGETLDKLGVSPDLRFLSFEHGRAKPGSYLYETARDSLQRLGIRADETVMVGNDMLNDIAASQGLGFKTALFAGDRRSLRLRADDDRVTGVEPDIVITELPQLLECIGLSN